MSRPPCARRLPHSQPQSRRSSSGSRGGGRLVYVGAGTSGRLALVDAAECGPTFGLADGRILAIVAGGAHAHAVAQEAAEDDGLRRRQGHRRRPGRPVRRGRRALGKRQHALCARRRPRGVRSRRADGRRRVLPRLQARPSGRPRGRRGHRARGDRRLDADEGRNGAEARPEHDLDRDDGPARPDVREPDGRRRRQQREAAGTRPPRGRARDRRLRLRKPTRRWWQPTATRRSRSSPC